MEANPSSLSDGLLNVWRTSFFTRVSLGVQSLDDAELETLGRRHDAKLALEAMERLARSGLRMSVDLIFGIPGQTLRSWAASLRGVLDAGARHVSAYKRCAQQYDRRRRQRDLHISNEGRRYRYDDCELDVLRAGRQFDGAVRYEGDSAHLRC